MNSYLAGMEYGVESELIDLGTVPLEVLRALDSTALLQSLQHVVEQTGCPRMTEGSCSNPARFD